MATRKSAGKGATKKALSTVLGSPQPKKHVVRYDSPDDDEKVLDNFYPKKAAIEELGNPDKIKVTIEAA